MADESRIGTAPDRSFRRRSWLSVAVLGIVATGIVIWWLSARSSAPPSSPEGAHEPVETNAVAASNALEVDPDVQRAVGLNVQPVGRRSISETIQTTGVVGPDETRLTHLRPLAEGRVTDVQVRAGDRVAANEVLLRYDSITAGELLAEYRAAVATLGRSTAEADVARRALERADSLVEIGAIARGERERRAADHQRALAEVSSARAAIANLEQKLRRLGVSQDELDRARAGGTASVLPSSVVSPFGGVVLEVHAAQGEVITPERELFTIADLSRVWVQGDVYQKDIAKVRTGQNVVVTVDAYPDTTFTGKVVHVSDMLDPATRTAKVRCEVPNPDRRLKFQMFASLALPVSASHQGLVIPARAVQEIDGVPVVFVRTSDKTFEKRPVRVGATVGDGVEIAEGLKGDESVVTEGALMLKSRLKLRVESEGKN